MSLLLHVVLAAAEFDDADLVVTAMRLDGGGDLATREIRGADFHIRAYTRHRVHDDPFRNVGRQDLTAHVDLTTVERAAATAGLDHVGSTTQAAFLTGLGAGDLLVGLQTDPSIDMGAYLEARSALFRLLDPTATGRFAVQLFGRDLAAGPPLRGLAFRMSRG